MKAIPNRVDPAENQATTVLREPPRRWLEFGFQLLAVVLGFLHVWADTHYLMNADAMSYLDVAEAYLRRDWSTAINAYWSPLYSWLIGLALVIVRPTPYWKFAVVHLVNFAIYLLALAAFGLLLREIIRRQRAQRQELQAAGLVNMPDWALLALGYSLFIWSSLFLITVQLESPDMLVALFVYLACAILLRLRRQPSWKSYALLGIVLGFGYLAKSVMLPMALVFLAGSLFAPASLRRAVPRVVMSSVIFLAIAGPYVYAISHAKGRLTFGDSGKLNYLWSIDDVTAPHWQGEEPGSGTPAHPTRKILDQPSVFEFGEPVGGTYPVWYDPTYWYEGSTSHFELKEQLRVLLTGAKALYELFHVWGLQYGLLVGIAALYVMGGNGRLLTSTLIREWSLIIPAIVGIALYSLISVQGRYLAAFITLLWLALFSAVRIQHTPNSQRYLRSISLVLVATIIFTTVASSSREVGLALSNLVTSDDASEHEQWQVAEGLREMGMTRNDRVAVIGNSFRAFWAHLLGLRIVAEIHIDRAKSFWEEDPVWRARVIDAFARTSARAVVAEKPPPGSDLNGWQKIRNTEYYVYMLNRGGPTTGSSPVSSF